MRKMDLRLLRCGDRYGLGLWLQEREQRRDTGRTH